MSIDFGGDAAEPAAAPATEPAAASGAVDVPRTGVAAVDAAAARLADIDDVPLDEHVAGYEDVHRRLQEGLADLDEQ